MSGICSLAWRGATCHRWEKSSSFGGQTYCLTESASAAYLVTLRYDRCADEMLRPRKTIDAASTRARLDELQAAIRREAEGAEADPFDDAMVAAVLGAAEALKDDADALAEIEARLGRLARKV